jgi:hypothetical protein
MENVVEVMEYGKLGVTRISEISLKDAKHLISKALENPYEEDKIE